MRERRDRFSIKTKVISNRKNRLLTARAEHSLGCANMNSISRFNSSCIIGAASWQQNLKTHSRG